MLAQWVNAWIRRRGVTLRPPDFIVGDPRQPYLLRWWVIPRNRWFNVYLHCILRSDDDRALHDHPWCWASLMLEGAYIEHTIAAGGVHHRALFAAGSLRVHRSGFAHRLEALPEYGECWTLFVTGPLVRQWGFHCARGWVPWVRFTKPGKPGEVGRGCD